MEHTRDRRSAGAGASADASATTPPHDTSRREFLKEGAVGAAALCVGLHLLGPRRASAQSAELGLIGRRRSPWFRQLDRRQVECTLCPRRCRISPGQRGHCRVRENIDGTGYTLVHGTPSLVQLGPVERMPFYHVLPGARALSVSTAGCPLECAFCEVWDMALVSPEEVYSYDLPPDQIVGHARSAGARAVSYAFGEPIAFLEFAVDTAVLARRAGLFNLVHTSAYINPEPLAAFAPLIDAANVDLKSFEPRFYRDVCGGALEPVLDSLLLLKAAGVHIEITTPIIPSLNDEPASIRRMARWIRDELGPDVPLHFARFYPLYKLSNLPPTPVSTLDRARAAALEEGLHYVYVARVTGHEGEKTYCPACAAVAVDRLGFIVEEIGIRHGRCVACGAPIAGRWE